MRVFAAVMALALTGCVVAPVYYQESLKSDSSASQAVLVLGDSGNLIVRTLDGKELANPLTTWNGGYYAVREMHLLPGTHTLVGASGQGGFVQSFRISYTFEAGGRYKIFPKSKGYGMTIEIKRIDGDETK